VHGMINFDPELIDDFIVRKADGFPVYNFACVIDDMEMGITHVIRGDDHTSNTPRQIMVYNALGAKVPTFSHIPMILGEDGARLSKRHGATSVAEYRKKGYLPDALLNFLALLGWSPGNDLELMSRDVMIEKFTLDRVNKTSAQFDNTKLDWMNGQYIMKASTETLAEQLEPFFVEAKIDNTDKVWMGKLIELYRDRFKTLQEFVDKTTLFFSDDIVFNEKSVKKFLQKEAQPGAKQAGELLQEACDGMAAIENFNEEELEKVLKALIDKYSIGFGKLAQPIRVAISGDCVSASIFETLVLLGKERTINRIQNAIDQFCPKR